MKLLFAFRLESTPKDLSSMAGLVVFAQQPEQAMIARRGRSRLGRGCFCESSRALARNFHISALWVSRAGSILNLMPCVLPVISLKIFGFVQRAGQSRQKIFRSGIAFTIGIFAWFIALAVLLIALKGPKGRDVTWGGFQFTNPSQFRLWS